MLFRLTIDREHLLLCLALWRSAGTGRHAKAVEEKVTGLVHFYKLHLNEKLKILITCVQSEATH